jgi:chemotaxis protein CheD
MLDQARRQAIGSSKHAHQARTAMPKEIMLMPGELFFGKDVPCLRTLLGSCVAVTLWNPRLRIGGMCHFLLPSRSRPANTPRDGKYGDEAIGMLVDAIKRTGSLPGDYEAHLYGGADTMPDLERAMRYVGERNIEMGWKLIDEHGFQLVGVDVGENIPRVVRMNLLTGQVEMSRGVSAR